MSMVVSRNQRIHYLLEGERGPFVVMMLPFMYHLSTWYRLGYVKALADHCRLILITPLGQGRSDAPEDPSHYTMEARAQHVIDVVNELSVKYFHYFGAGLGGQVGFELALRYPQRVRSLTVAHSHPYPVTTELPVIEALVDRLREHGPKAYLETFDDDKNLSEEQHQEFLSGSLEAYITSLETSSKWGGIADQLKSVQTPTLLFTATHEDKFLAIREAGRTLPHGRYVILPQLNYQEGILSTDLTIEPFTDFIKKQRWQN